MRLFEGLKTDRWEKGLSREEMCDREAWERMSLYIDPP